ncbi:Thioesterase/thiol ester dehydrase-isomerase [Xylariaceae sp. FL1651]|nr:Thioesterase/thiol ester dehydrase-isomerase [Xylariaceae sp. FL1651]
MSVPSAKAVKEGDGRLTFQEAMGLVPLLDRTIDDGKVVKRYMSRRKVWVSNKDLIPLAMEHGVGPIKTGTSAYGGHVYSQAGLAASRAFRATQRVEHDSSQEKKKTFGIHTIHGFFSEAGLDDRPFIYEATSLASNALFPNLLVTARQPTSPSINPEGDHYVPADADLPLGPVCFSALVSFRPAGVSQLDVQEPSPQTRFASILNARRPTDWAPAPITDIDGVLAILPGARQAVGLFPGVEMRKVDMRAYNADRPLHERRELILYRLLAPLPTTNTMTKSDDNNNNNKSEGRKGGGKDGGGEEDEEGFGGDDGADAHILAHAYAADRNGLLMLSNHAGFGFELARAASLSYSFVVHVDVEDAVMTYGDGDGDDDEWWVQEACFPRVRAGRGIIHSKIWSPRGVHVATEYQDGIVRRRPRPGDRDDKAKGKDREKL